MAKKPKPSKLIFMVKTAKRRTQPEELKVELKMEHEQCHAWYKYISGELAKIATVMEAQEWPPGHSAPAPTAAPVEQPVTPNPFE